MLKMLNIRRLRLLGHLCSMSAGRLPKDILYSEISSGAKNRDRPLFRVRDAAKRDIVALDIPPDNWEELAENRPRWRRRLRNQGIRLDKEWFAKPAKKSTEFIHHPRLWPSGRMLALYAAGRSSIPGRVRTKT